MEIAAGAVRQSDVDWVIKQTEFVLLGQSSLTENEIVASFEILDGTPKTG